MAATAADDRPPAVDRYLRRRCQGTRQAGSVATRRSRAVAAPVPPLVLTSPPRWIPPRTRRAPKLAATSAWLRLPTDVFRTCLTGCELVLVRGNMCGRYDLVATLLLELDPLFPDVFPFFHLGGDEVGCCCMRVLLVAACCVLRAAAACCSLRSACCLLAACCLLHVICCLPALLLLTACCLLATHINSTVRSTGRA